MTSQALEHFTCPRGEFTLVIGGKTDKEKPELTQDIEYKLRHMRFSGLTAKEAIAKVVGETGLSKKELYQIWVKLS
jgi:16S rRNA C1402 (ribose-2'-O) methylase RsmI